MPSPPTPAGATQPTTVPVEVVSWITRFIGGDGTGRRVLQEPYAEGVTIRTVLRNVTARYPELHAALWHGQELGEHVEVLVNDAVLGVEYELDSPLKPGDQISLLGQYMGG
jgi:molybdopterin converting factor small subunit